MYYTHPGCQISIFGENCAYCIRDFTVCAVWNFMDKNEIIWSNSYFCSTVHFFATI